MVNFSLFMDGEIFGWSPIVSSFLKPLSVESSSHLTHGKPRKTPFPICFVQNLRAFLGRLHLASVNGDEEGAKVWCFGVLELMGQLFVVCWDCQSVSTFFGATLPETNSSPMKIPIFPGKYHQNGGFFYGYVSLQKCTRIPQIYEVV